MIRQRMLFVGSHPSLVTRLETDFDVAVEADLDIAQAKLSDEWFSLAVIQLRPGEGVEDEERLQFCLNIDGIVPRIILCPGRLDQRGLMVRRALARLEQSLPVLTVIMEADGVQSILDTIKQAARNISIDTDKPRLDGIDFYTIAHALMPDSNPGKWVEELQLLFAQLFRDCVAVRFENPDFLPKKNGEMVAMLARPESQSVSNHHPLIVKCGRREYMEDLETHYKSHYFPLSPVRLAGTAKTTHFSAMALPASFHHVQTLETFTSFYCNQEFGDSGIKKILEVVDRLFDTTCQPWYVQDRVPDAEDGKTLDAFFAETWRLKDVATFRSKVDHLRQTTQGKSIGLEVNPGVMGHSSTLKFTLGEQIRLFPNPLDYLLSSPSVLANMIPSNVQITHGDFRGANLCVDAKGQIVLEGYENLAWRPAVADVAALESTIKYHCLGIRAETRNLKLLYEMERTLLEPSKMSETLVPNVNGEENKEIQKAMRVIEHLRRTWGAYFQTGGIREYYACLFYFAMRELVSEDHGSNQRPDMRKLHALLSAAMICHRIEKWGADSPWPGATIPYGG